MSARSVVVRSLSALVLGLLPSMALADTPPVEMHLAYTVLKGKDPIGHHQIDLTRDGDTANVAIKTHVLVKIAMVPVYRFEHTGSEVWEKGRLVSLRSQTNDDGDKHNLVVTAKDGHVEVNGDGTDSSANSEIIPASLWNFDLVKQTVLLNTLTGKQMNVAVADLGDDPIHSRGSEVPAHHYKLTGDLQRELWYDPSGILLQVKFKAKNDSDILYVLE